jgi:Na+/H+ antiporter NhaD/arsenite permease-like protein
MILWFSSIMSGIIDNVPFVAAFIPVMKEYSFLSGLDISQLWWALAIGAGFGGNLTVIGASSNVVALSATERRGLKVTFFEFMKIGLLVVILSVTIANLMLVSVLLV